LRRPRRPGCERAISLSSPTITLGPITVTARVALATLAPGSRGAVRKTVSPADVDAFAALLGDSNEIHVAPASRPPAPAGRAPLFGGGRQVAHGMLGAGLIGTVFGTQIAGCVYVAQSLRFRRPVFAGDTIEAAVTVLEISPRGAPIARCATTVTRIGSGGEPDELVIEGEAKVLLPLR
jgi:3-hydroxybutyryl-CoA dehydratase